MPEHLLVKLREFWAQISLNFWHQMLTVKQEFKDQHQILMLYKIILSVGNGLSLYHNLQLLC